MTRHLDDLELAELVARAQVYGSRPVHWTHATRILEELDELRGRVAELEDLLGRRPEERRSPDDNRPSKGTAGRIRDDDGTTQE